MGSVLGSFLGAAFIILLPLFLQSAMQGAFGSSLRPGLEPNIEQFVFGSLIIFFLIVEPQGLARLWQVTKEKLRLWPFPH
jgi:branched-chain amino acid transport system permease protein